MDGDSRRQFLLKDTDRFIHKAASAIRTKHQRNLISGSQFNDFIGRFQISAENHAWNTRLKNFLIHFHPVVFIIHFNISAFYHADNLKPLVIKMLKKSGQLQRRTVNICLFNKNLICIYIGI